MKGSLYRGPAITKRHAHDLDRRAICSWRISRRTAGRLDEEGPVPVAEVAEEPQPRPRDPWKNGSLQNINRLFLAVHPSSFHLHSARIQIG